MGDKCEHGCEGECMKCIREGEGKPCPPSERPAKSFEECMEEDVPWAHS